MTAFGILPDGSTVSRFVLKNQNGMECSILDYGGIITSLLVPDKNEVVDNVVLGYDSIDPYIADRAYLGAIIGRYANRIDKGRIHIGDKLYQLTINDGQNHLHGGIDGFNKVLWKAEPFKNDQGPGLKLEHLSLDGTEGYPGNLQVEVSYLLLKDNSLSIEYRAETDQTTIVNLTQHSYFNLSGRNDILDHHLKINSAHFLPTDDEQIPTGLMEPVDQTEFDFRELKRIGNGIESEDEQLVLAQGYDHTYVLDGQEPAATLWEPVTGRVLKVFTTEPGLQFYSGNQLRDPLRPRQGLCLEPHHYPDSPNQPGFPSVLLPPGEQYYSKTIYQFSCQ